VLSVKRQHTQLRAIRKNRAPIVNEKAILLELQDILDKKKISTVFQPVVSLVDATVLGYEALSRGPQGSVLERPDALFGAATSHDLNWELEYICRAKALENAKNMLSDKMIFINVDPKIINDPRFSKGQTREMLDNFRANAGNIIFEITEKTAIEDYMSFCRILDNYTSQGYKIAIDDAGSGYSGLRMLAQTHPHFIKVDMDLVRNIDKDGLKQALMEALNDFSVTSNSKIIAEGIETEEELATLIRLGVPYGQGFFLQRPVAGFSEISSEVRQIILEKNERKKRQSTYTPLTMPIGEITQPSTYLAPSVPGVKALEYFNTYPSVHAIPVVQNGQPVGLLMKNKFLASLATQYGVAVYMNRPISMLMDRNPLVMDYDTPLEVVSRSAISRKDDDIYDYILITKDTQYHGVVTIKRLLEKTTQLELNRAKHSNPLTGLPGNVMIEGELNKLPKETGEYAVLYFDLDNFKSYNDVYGFEKGDKIIFHTAELIQRQLGEWGVDKFFGHIGGDDFVAIVRGSGEVAKLCEKIIAEFDGKIGDFYNDSDKQRGFIYAKNRRGQQEEFPLISISIAVVTNRCHSYLNPAALTEAAALLKKKCKLTWQSCYCIDD
jgi:EAL domain-containing protein (putative c-di-GMP-specific phosphodiesterase class I)/GGDEF domain-containing protein